MASITLTKDQANVVDSIARWARDPSGAPHFTLAGYAGTGKTTIIRSVIEASDRKVRCCTPTGKAAHVLEFKLPEGAEVSTLHSFLYAPVEVTEKDVEHALKVVEELTERDLPHRDAYRRYRKLIEMLEKGSCEFRDQDDPNYAPFVIVDEASMVGDKIERDLRAAAGKILFVGDPGQLPPVEGTEFFKRNEPDAVLEQIHRQAADSTILRLATAVRRGEKFDDWNDDDCVLVRGAMDPASLLEAHQVITGMNVTRRRLNRDMRHHQGHGAKLPELGEPVMCLRNERGLRFINGVAGIAASAAVVDTFGDAKMDISYEGRLMKRVALDTFAFEQYERPTLTRRDMPPTGDSQFDFGYAITVHKSQGSEWAHVVVWDDKMRRNDEEARKRWIYTAATRASARLTWVNAGR